MLKNLLFLGLLALLSCAIGCNQPAPAPSPDSSASGTATTNADENGSASAAKEVPPAGSGTK